MLIPIFGYSLILFIDNFKIGNLTMASDIVNQLGRELCKGT
ncbi:MAG: hypothetical protein BAJATHORv1_10332 [Candidatus Thorarchaeota archaeon]|nr:MAG: hypothetical protein BAJATHORv1_10332 [Candidatus Thorarchaeota archaeon]